MGNEYPDFMSPWHERMQVDVSNELHTSRVELPSALGNAKSQEELTTTRTMVIEAHRIMQDILCDQLLGYIHVQSSEFFENLIIDVVVALGYAGRRRDMARKLGRSGDGGIDGVIELDELGLDAIYLQAKRLKPATTVPVSQVRDFVGALEAHHASKGVFVTSGNFTPSAQAIVKAISKKIVLINGQRLTQLMIQFNIGIRITDSLQFKEVDRSYFADSTTRPASSQPRK